MTKKHPTILLFLKAPRPGFVKTRLARSLGDEQACSVYRLLVDLTLQQVPSDWSLRIHFAPASASEEMVAWLGADRELIPQPEGDLGHRLAIACEQAFTSQPPHAKEDSPHPGVILLGGDCPALTTRHLEECARHLAAGSPVVGPSGDGGYWLLGLPHPQPDLFCDMAWSTAEVLPTTLKRFAAKGQTPVHLETLNDVDDLATWEEAKKALPPTLLNEL